MTSKPTWTAGPWYRYAEELESRDRRQPWIYGGGSIGEPTARLICTVGNGSTFNEGHAEWSTNARLIAAAPELYEALERLTKATDRLMQNIHEFDKPTDQEFGDAVDHAIFLGTMALKNARGE